MPKPVTYRQLYQHLIELGFAERSVADSHTAYAHVPSDTQLLFGLHDPREPVAPHDLSKVRRVLDERGLLPVAEFEVWVAAAGRPKRRPERSPA